MSQSSTKDFPRKQQIEIFFNSHKSKSQLHDVSVTDMRHMIPLIFMEVYAEKCGQYTKKVKGLWEKRPPDWPANVPFVDPNNKLKNEGGVGCKPKKELLGQMLNYLIKRYEKAQNGGPTMDLEAVIPLLSDPGPPMFNLIESDDPLLGQNNNSADQNQILQELINSSSGSNHSQSMPHSAPNEWNISEEDFGEFLLENSRIFKEFQELEELIKPPEQAMDNDDCNLGDGWNPSAQLQRIQQKLNYLEKQKLVKHTKLESMVARYKKLKEVDYASTDLSSLIDDLHALEKEIDIIKFSKRMPTKRISEISSDKSTTDLKKLDNLENENVSYDIYMVADDSCNDVQIRVEDPELMTSLNIEPRSGGPQDSGPVNNLSLRFVSGLGPELLNPSPPNVSVMSENRHGGPRPAECLSFHYVSQPLSEAQNVGFPMSTMLSENCKPIQAAEDDIQQCQNPLQDLGDLLHFQQNTSFTLDEDLSFLDISNGHEPSARTFAPVEEINNTINLTYLDVGQVNAASGNAGAVPQFILPGNNGLGGQISSAASIASAEATKNVTIPADLLHLLLQHASRAIAQPAPVVAEQKSVSNGFQPPATNSRRDVPVKPGGKRTRVLLDIEEEMEVAVSNLQPSPEISCNTLIPTMVEEMGDSDSMLRFPKKSKKMF